MVQCSVLRVWEEKPGIESNSDVYDKKQVQYLFFLFAASTARI